jgi:hypothetical protein
MQQAICVIFSSPGVSNNTSHPIHLSVERITKLEKSPLLQSA